MIEINNSAAGRVEESFVRKVAKKVLMEENEIKAGLSIAFVDSEKIQELNCKYRRKDRPTDVLAFLYQKKKDFFAGPQVGLGEIIICPREVNKNVKFFKTDFKKELTRVLIHGILHLLGHDHEGSKKKAEEMRKKEDYYLSKL